MDLYDRGPLCGDFDCRFGTGAGSCMIDILNFIFKLHFYDTFIAYYHYDIFSLGLGHFIEVISLLALVNLAIVFTLTDHINILDPVEIITGR